MSREPFCARIRSILPMVVLGLVSSLQAQNTEDCTSDGSLESRQSLTESSRNFEGGAAPADRRGPKIALKIRDLVTYYV